MHSFQWKRLQQLIQLSTQNICKRRNVEPRFSNMLFGNTFRAHHTDKSDKDATIWSVGMSQAFNDSQSQKSEKRIVETLHPLGGKALNSLMCKLIGTLSQRVFETKRLIPQQNVATNQRGITTCCFMASPRATTSVSCPSKDHFSLRFLWCLTYEKSAQLSRSIWQRAFPRSTRLQACSHYYA